MIADRDQGITVESTVTGDKVAMGVRAEDMGHLMGVLTDLYSNKVRAVIREYSTNALDAQIEAGVTRPIEVTLPGALSPFFKVRDFGIGLSVDDITDIYSQYGRSTKRSSNEVVGMLGLGCKSALTYCSLFTVSSVQNGTKITVEVGRDEDGRGSMTVVDTVATDEPNGTTVIVPAGRTDYERFASEARDFYSVWKPGTVLLNGEAPARFSGLRVTDSIYITSDPTARIVMGNVAYPAPALSSAVPTGSLLVFVPIGSVNFTPSREALMDTRRTQETIQGLHKEFSKEVHNAIQREVDKCATAADAVRTVVRWQVYIPGYNRHSAVASIGSYVYKGASLPTSMDLPAGTLASHNGPSRLGQSSNITSLAVGSWPTTVFVENYAPTTFVANHKKKLRHWCAEQGIVANEDVRRSPDGSLVRRTDTVAHFVMVPGKLPDNPFIDRSMVADWEDVRKIKLSVAAPRGSSGRIPGSYDVAICKDSGASHKRGLPGAEFPASYPIYYLHGTMWEAHAWGEVIAKHQPTALIVALPGNRLAKFRRDVPQAVEVAKHVENLMGEWVKNLTHKQRLALTIHDASYSYRLGASPRNILADLHADSRRIDDPALRESGAVAKMDIDTLLTQRRGFQILSRRRSDAESLVHVKWTNPLKRYPLIDSDALRAHRSHVILYINAVYADGTTA